MSRFIPEHPKKGSAEAYEWAERMRQARLKKKRTKARVREAGRKTEQKFFGKGGPLEVKPRRNPGEKWHEGAAKVAGRYRKEAQSQTEKHIYAGMEIAHKDSASAARKLGMNPSEQWIIIRNDGQSFMTTNEERARALESKPGYLVISLSQLKKLQKQVRFKKNPIAIYNPPSQVAGTIYNKAIEIRAKKTQGNLAGKYKHIFGKGVRILGLTDGTVLLQHKDGKPLWISRKDYERGREKH